MEFESGMGSMPDLSAIVLGDADSLAVRHLVLHFESVSKRPA